MSFSQCLQWRQWDFQFCFKPLLDLLLLKFVIFQFKSPLKAEVGNFFLRTFWFLWYKYIYILYDFLNFIIFPDHCVKLFLKGYTQKVCKAVKSVFFEDYRLNIVGFVTHCPIIFTTKVVFFGFHWHLWQIHSFQWFMFKRGGKGWRGGQKVSIPPCYSFTHLTDTA